MTKAGLHIPLLTAQAQHLAATNIALRNNSLCIRIMLYFFQSVSIRVWDLQSQISADFDDCCSRRPFRNSFPRQHTFDDLHVHIRDKFEYIPAIPREIDDDSDFRKMDFIFDVKFRPCGSR